jgi:FtsZ-interacting cell division protein ZipA
VLIRILNIAIAVIAIGVFVGWMRNRRREDFRDISRAEVSADLAAQDELLEDALTEQSNSRSEWAESPRATPRDRAD